MRARALAVLAAAALAGCIDVPGGDDQRMCERTEDCDVANGEICAEGICWGDPPASVFAVRVAPPAGRTDLVTTDFPVISIEPNGWFENLVLEEPITLSGSIFGACPPAIGCGEPRVSIAATISVTRASRIDGGPAYVTTTMSEAGVVEGAGNSYSIKLPRAQPDETYYITVTPIRDRLAVDALPPARQGLNALVEDTELDVELGASTRVVTGRILGPTGTGQAGWQVSARGKWDAMASTMTDVSGVALTQADGSYALYVPANIYSAIEVWAAPPDNDPTKVTLVRHVTLSQTQNVTAAGAMETQDYGAGAEVALPIVGESGSGGVGPVAGARVSITTTINLSEWPEAPMTTRGVFTSTDETDASGVARLYVLGDVHLYRVYVRPPPDASGDSRFGTLYDAPLEIGPGQSPPAMQLPRQVQVGGILTDAFGNPAEGVTVTVVPNSAFAYDLPTEVSRQLDEIVPASQSTNSNGEFSVFVDPEVADQAAVYDIRFDPGPGSLLPSWQLDGVLLDEQAGMDLRVLALPQASHVRSVVYEPGDLALAGATVRVYEIPAAVIACVQTRSCEGGEQALLRAQADSEDEDGLGLGVVHLVLPDP